MSCRERALGRRRIGARARIAQPFVARIIGALPVSWGYAEDRGNTTETKRKVNATMSTSETIARLRRKHGLTQEELAAKLYVTRQAVSRWERGEVVPGIDMLKLIAIALDEPVMRLLDAPERYCQSCGMALAPTDFGTDADGAPNGHYCKWCYEQGEYTYETTMDDMIEDCAPRLAQNTGMSLDEAVSLMGAILPTLKRWSAVHSNEMRFGAEARERYGNAAVDAANEKLMGMTEAEWSTREELESAIIGQLAVAMATGDARSAEAAKLASMHTQWIKMSWGNGAYSPEAHRALAQTYPADARFADYYDSRAGAGAAAFLAAAIEENVRLAE